NEMDAAHFFYGKMYTINTLLQPISFNHNRDINNYAIVPYSLSLHGDDGLVTNFFLEWITIKRLSELVKINLYMNEETVKLLAENDYVMIDNIRMLQNRLLIDYPIKKNPQAELQAYIA
ncbi:MAG TPA: hypothetical protein PL045_13535, partial [Chitinophagaceae bacterium]|nr:hypothetical protein [Chitinophagaceae bacterium]